MSNNTVTIDAEEHKYLTDTLYTVLIKLGHALIGTKQYAVIDNETAKQLQLMPNMTRAFVIENEDMMYTDLTNVPLPRLENGLCRLWSRQTFDILDNARKQRANERERAKIELAEMVRTAAGIFHRQMNGLMTMETCCTLAEKLSATELRMMIEANGGK